MSNLKRRIYVLSKYSNNDFEVIGCYSNKTVLTNALKSQMRKIQTSMNASAIIQPQTYTYKKVNYTNILKILENKTHIHISCSDDVLTQFKIDAKIVNNT